MARTVLRRVGGALLLLLALVLGLVAAPAGLLCTAALTPVVPLFVLGGLVALSGVVYAVAWGAFAVLRTNRPRRAALIAAVATTCVVSVLAGVTVFRPMPRPAGAAAGPDVRYRDLPTGSRIAYSHVAAVGTPRPDPVVFLHGGPGTANDGVSDAGKALAADGFEVYAYDQIGSGRSGRLDDPSGYTVARHVADLDALRVAIGAERIIVVGQSWGGALAAHYLAAHPDHVAKAVLSSPGVLWYGAFPDDKTGDLWDRLPASTKQHVDELASTPRMVAMALLQQVNPKAAHALVGDREVDTRFREILGASLPAAQCPGRPAAHLPDNRTGFYVNQFTIDDAEHLPDPRPRLRDVHVPTLIMRGQCDYKKWAVTYDYRKTLPASTLVYVPDAGHAIAIDQPELYLANLRAYLLDRPLPLPAYTGTTPPPGTMAP
ncbi:alpha/beta fold hydrolase [Streptomyces sp. SID3343]|uniref:alpha/beta fold hydrolase n=1 Tax=Streptomyces sp. SID3343 TaxID=2690260 RepID=UPI00136EB149|nr:alpha/beta fold hydrolase [Streptomyces sp. SID3343]MYW03029.1 alpha/beta fold hydrolase [Streptomyces sp. SID3343]